MPGIEPGSATLGDSSNLYLPWDSHMFLSQSEMHGGAYAGNHETVDDAVADALVSANTIRREMHPVI